MDDHQDIINLIKSTPAIEPPGDFTPRVMAMLTAAPDRGILSQIRNVLLQPMNGSSNSRWTQTLPVSNTRECSFYFFITGFFYLIIGIVLLAGFKGISSGMAAMDWIRLQPHLTIGIAVWLLLLGMILLREGKNTIKLIKFGTLFYILLAIVNGGLMHLYFRIPYADIFILGFIGTGVTMGVMLTLAVEKIELRPV